MGQSSNFISAEKFYSLLNMLINLNSLGVGGLRVLRKGYFSFGRCTYRPLLSLDRPLLLEWPALDERMYPMTRRKSSQLHKEAHKPRSSSCRKKSSLWTTPWFQVKDVFHTNNTLQALRAILQVCVLVPLKRHIKTYWLWKELFNYWHHCFV